MSYDIKVLPMGRLGNRIAQCLVGIWFAECHKARIDLAKVISGQPLLKRIPQLWDFSASGSSLSKVAASWKTFPGCDLVWPPESDARRIMRTYVLPHLVIPEVRQEQFVIHIRSGDLFTDASLFKHGWENVAGKFMCPPPFRYYANIIEREAPKRICIVSSDLNNPVIPRLLDCYGQANLYIETMEAAFSRLVFCKTLVMSYSSFAEAAFIASSTVQRCYSMFKGHMRRPDVHRVEYRDTNYTSKPWNCIEERSIDLIHWDYQARFVDYPPEPL